MSSLSASSSQSSSTPILGEAENAGFLMGGRWMEYSGSGDGGAGASLLRREAMERLREFCEG
jgi:hypothetical protein